jgi:peptidoglycan/LPS O-acetylase OafA/YrhL
VLVIAAHTLPLGPKIYELNATAGTVGMALFFVLSGFLITTFLLTRPEPGAFLIRRICRIVPLAWLTMAVCLYLNEAPFQIWVRHLSFAANLPPFGLLATTGHFWSLCVEMHFYFLCAALVFLGGRRGIYMLPAIGVLVTVFRIGMQVPYSIETYYRVDEIFAGATLALLYQLRPELLRSVLHRCPWWVFATLLAAASHPKFPLLNYARPYFAAALIGRTLLMDVGTFALLLRHRLLAYIASISFAMYVFHPLIFHTWIGEGEGWVKYAKRPIGYMILWATSHVSTQYFESFWIALGKKMTTNKVGNS